jgi:D-glycero-alpha-D-manno-heptose 1-phosphate guanylyltransferase
MEAIVLAGGKGTRLAGHLDGRPKPMADIGGRPFLELLLERLASQGVRRIILSVGYLGDTIRRHFGDSYQGLDICYAVEETPLGTGGAIKNALQSATHSDVFVVNGDTFLKLDYRSMFAAHRAAATMFTMAVREVPDVARYGAIVTDAAGIIQVFGEKLAAGKGFINTGTYLLNRKLFEPFDLPETFSVESEFLAVHLNAIRPLAFKTSGYFIDIGIPEDLAKARRELGDRSLCD